MIYIIRKGTKQDLLHCNYQSLITKKVEFETLQAAILEEQKKEMPEISAKYSGFCQIKFSIGPTGFIVIDEGTDELVYQAMDLINPVSATITFEKFKWVIENHPRNVYLNPANKVGEGVQIGRLYFDVVEATTEQILTVATIGSPIVAL